ncbi:MAG: hypothetical protein SFW67_29005 [Myxococcaceae bacterium]|nr:hypothetical protein [Myxococcaceae bacterium]
MAFSWHSPAGTALGPALAPASVTRQPTSMTPFESSRSHALFPLAGGAAWPGTPSASTAPVAVVSMSLFQPCAFTKVTAVSVNVEVAVRPFRSASGTRNSTTSLATEMLAADPTMAYQVPESNHSTSGLPEPAT